MNDSARYSRTPNIPQGYVVKIVMNSKKIFKSSFFLIMYVLEHIISCPYVI